MGAGSRSSAQAQFESRHVLFQIEDWDAYIQKIVTMAITQGETQ